jgi:hypothetical protein
MPIERVAIAGQDLQHAAGTRRPRRRRRRAGSRTSWPACAARSGARRACPPATRGPRRAPSDLRRALGVELELPAQRARQPGVVALALVHLDQGLERRVVVGPQLDDLLDTARSRGAARPDARGRCWRSGARCRRDRSAPPSAPWSPPPRPRARRRAAPTSGPATTAAAPPPWPWGCRARAPRCAPGVERARHVAQPQLADLRDLLEPPHQLAWRRRPRGRCRGRTRRDRTARGSRGARGSARRSGPARRRSADRPSARVQQLGGAILVAAGDRGPARPARAARGPGWPDRRRGRRELALVRRASSATAAPRAGACAAAAPPGRRAARAWPARSSAAMSCPRSDARVVERDHGARAPGGARRRRRCTLPGGALGQHRSSSSHRSAARSALLERVRRRAWYGIGADRAAQERRAAGSASPAARPRRPSSRYSSQARRAPGPARRVVGRPRRRRP